jgi:hypothetical protein
MDELRIAKMVIEILVVVVAVLVLGDYLGYKVGRWKLAGILGVVALVCVIAFAIFAVVMTP